MAGGCERELALMRTSLVAIRELVVSKKTALASMLLDQLIAQLPHQSSSPAVQTAVHSAVQRQSGLAKGLPLDCPQTVFGLPPNDLDRARVRSSDSDASSTSSEEEKDQDLRVEASDARELGLQSTQQSGLPNGLPNGLSEGLDFGDQLRMWMADTWDQNQGHSTSGLNRHRISQAEPVLRRLAAERGRAPLDLWREASERFRADPVVKKRRFGLPVFCSQLEQWVDPVARETASCAPAPREVFVAEHARYMAGLSTEQRAAHVEPDAEGAF